jgi:hypothetical protein
MPLKLSAGLTKKVGLPNYGSLGAACHVELELDSSLLQSPEALQSQVQLAYDVCRQAVELELAREPEEPVPANGHTNGHVETSVPATDRQINYARQLASEIPGIGWRGLDSTVEQRFEKSIAKLTRNEASRIIERLQQIKAGHLQPPSLWETPLD